MDLIIILFINVRENQRVTEVCTIQRHRQQSEQYNKKHNKNLKDEQQGPPPKNLGSTYHVTHNAINANLLVYYKNVMIYNMHMYIQTEILLNNQSIN